MWTCSARTHIKDPDFLQVIGPRHPLPRTPLCQAPGTACCFCSILAGRWVWHLYCGCPQLYCIYRLWMQRYLWNLSNVEILDSLQTRASLGKQAGLAPIWNAGSTTACLRLHSRVPRLKEQRQVVKHQPKQTTLLLGLDTAQCSGYGINKLVPGCCTWTVFSLIP